MRRTRTITHAGRNLTYTCARARAYIHTHAHAEMYARIFAFLIRRKRQHGDWSTVSTCACTTGGKGGKGDSYGEAKSIERDAGKSACTRTQQRQQRRQQQQQQRQHPPMISPSRSFPDRSSLLFLSFLPARRVEAICIAMNATNHPASIPPSSLAKPPSPSFQPLSVAG